MDAWSDADRRDARSVEIVLALGLGVLTFLGLVLGGWLLGHAFDLDLRGVGPALVAAAGVVAGGVVVRQLVRARRRGL